MPAPDERPSDALYDAVTADYDLDHHELLLLGEACRTADLCADLEADLAERGVMLDGRVNPAATELRQQRIVLARLLVALRIPTDDDAMSTGAPRTQRRGGARGVYMLGGAE